MAVGKPKPGLVDKSDPEYNTPGYPSEKNQRRIVVLQCSCNYLDGLVYAEFGLLFNCSRNGYNTSKFLLDFTHTFTYLKGLSVEKDRLLNRND